MAVTFYYASGSPYAWRVWLALEHKGVPHDFKLLSFDAGDLRKPEFVALNPRRKVPVLVDDGFALAESAAILEYIAERWPEGPRLFDADLKRRALQRRMIREADEYAAPAMEKIAEAILFTPAERRSEPLIAALRGDLEKELACWEAAIEGDWLVGAVSATDFTLFPILALVRRMDKRHPALAASGITGPRMTAWMNRMETLPAVQKTWPPHWK